MTMTSTKVVHSRPATTLTPALPSGTVGRNTLHVTAASLTGTFQSQCENSAEVSLRAHLLEVEAGHLAVTWQSE